MKTETQIAKENVIDATTGRAKFWHKAIAEKLKQANQRWLEFLEIQQKYQQWIDWTDQSALEKIEDLKQAIEIYNKNGI